MSKEGHGIALVALEVVDTMIIRVQCECGWYLSVSTVTTLDHINREVEAHLT